jgi:DNA-directed RNA polymerase specialized sigma24 family protein
MPDQQTTPTEADIPDRRAIAGATPVDVQQAAFRDLHGPRLHGFALLITLGDRSLAARIAGEAIAAGAERVSELSHPERAAAWLRRRVLRQARRLSGRPTSSGGGHRRAALEELGVDAAAFASLAGLDILERAALVASTVERLDQRDVATIVGMDGTPLDRLVRRSRTDAVRSGTRALSGRGSSDGPIAARVRAIAARAMA